MKEYQSIKKYEIRTVDSKYGFNQKGSFALQKIKKGLPEVSGLIFELYIVLLANNFKTK
jgi:hypothetical protein